MDVETLRLVRKAELRGSPYYEFVTGQWDGISNWSEDSVYVHLDGFQIFVPIFFDHVPDFDPFGPNSIPSRQLKGVVEELQNLADVAEDSERRGKLESIIRRASPDTWEEFRENLDRNANALASLARSLAGWLSEQRRKDAIDRITVLGI